MKRTAEEYKCYFDKLVETNISIVLFLDKQFDWTFPSNVVVYPVSLEECWVSTHIPKDVTLSKFRKDNTREYMMIQNSKPEFLYKASQINPFQTEWFAWIDFGIVHVFKTPETTLERLKKLEIPDKKGVYMSGIWPAIMPYENYLFGVCWRFAGGFVVAHKDLIHPFLLSCQRRILERLPEFTWEVNIWADLEHTFPIKWLPAEHNDSIIPYSF